MLDDMFTFIDPVFSTDENSLSEFIVQMEAFFTSQEETAGRLQVARQLTEEDYKQMWMLRYQQYMGQITFLELLDKYKEILGISSSSDSA